MNIGKEVNFLRKKVNVALKVCGMMTNIYHILEQAQKRYISCPQALERMSVRRVFISVPYLP